MNTKESTGIWPDFIPPLQYPNADLECETAIPDIARITSVAREHGYAIGLHGSMKRDCDLIAVAWTEKASSRLVLIEALCKSINARQIGIAETKPFHRIAVTLQVDGFVKPIDLSILRS